MSKPLHDEMITNLPTSSIQWVKNIFVANLMYIGGLAQDCSNSITNALELLQSCTKPSICFTCEVFPFIMSVIFLGLLPLHHIQNICKTYDGNSLVFERNGWNNADRFWWMQICWFQKKKKLNTFLRGLPIKFIMVQTMALNQQRNKPLTHWHLRDRNVIVKMHFFNIVLVIGIFRFSYDNATSYYLIKSGSGSMSPYVMH